ncbi:glycosyltransferase family 4 protein [Sulfitobacter sp. 1A16808]|uniref:glycosyltransferase family 4 protein n=1 Tax=Sulfitobacter sp. 1A16808 TaxID=3368572 RepID=UPI00374555B3
MIELDGIIFNLQKQGGISVYFSELVKYLACNNELYALSIFGSASGYMLKGGNVVRYPERPFERFRKAPCSNSGIFHSSYYRIPELTKDTSSVVTVHDFVYERRVGGIRRAVHTIQKHRAIREASAIICVSNSTAADLKYFLPDVTAPVHVIHNGVSEEFYRLDNKMFEQARPYILYVGNRSGYKNFDQAVRALDILPSEFQLFCVGGGAFSKRELASYSSQTMSRIFHLGNVSNGQLNKLYNEAVCLLYPSKYEGFGIPVIEAMRSGCPVVSIDCKAVLEAGGDALVVADDEPAAIAAAVERCFQGDRKAIIDAGQRRAAKFSWSSTHCRTVEVYRNLE